jgi:hypothetical protein
MPFIYPKKQPHLIPEEEGGEYLLQAGQFCMNHPDSTFIVSVNCVPVLCEYDWNSEFDSWTNPITRDVVHTTHPLGLTRQDGTPFYDGLVQITKIEDLTFIEGEAWCSDTNKKILVGKMDPKSIWNPLERRYDRPCHRKEHDCDPKRIAYNFLTNKFHELFKHNMDQFFEVYCECCRCKKCRNVHEWDCADASSRTTEL